NLSIFDEDGIRMVRTRELPISNLCADAMRIVSDAEIGFVNGGGVRTNLKSGDITYGDIINVHPYGNECSVIKATGKNILDHLEYTTYKTKAEYKTTNDLGVMVPNGEFGGFPCVSGIKFDLDVTKESKVKLDADGLFDKVDGDYRVSNVKVLKDGEYVDIEMNTYYTVATTNYIAFENGDGGTVFKECEKVTSGQIDYQNLIDYIVSLDGKLKDKYSTPEGRINIIS
nr:5'-nucleotidase C-terminal domain-containing protein [Acholeplasmatales bacterium]